MTYQPFGSKTKVFASEAEYHRAFFEFLNGRALSYPIYDAWLLKCGFTPRRIATLQQKRTRKISPRKLEMRRFGLTPKKAPAAKRVHLK